MRRWKVDLRQTDDYKVQPVPGVPQVSELSQGEAATHHFGGGLEGVDGREDHPAEK
jgi:hypothetical protein